MVNNKYYLLSYNCHQRPQLCAGGIIDIRLPITVAKFINIVHCYHYRSVELGQPKLPLKHALLLIISRSAPLAQN